MPTVQRILQLAPIAQYLSAHDNEENKFLFGGSPASARQSDWIFVLNKVLQKIYDADNTYPIQDVANYLYELMMKYAFKAAYIYDGGGGGQVVPSSGVTADIVSPISVTSDDFADSTHWNGVNSISQLILSSYTLQVFWDDSQIFLEKDVQWARTAEGINILIDGFDATANQYQFYIFVSK